MICPKCGKELIQSDRALGCSGWKDGCDFTIWNTIAGHTITNDEKQQLAEDGITKDEITDFVSRKGTNFSARLKLDDNMKVVFEFADKPAGSTVIDSGLKCPTCGSPIRKNEKAWGCSNRDCNVVIFNTLAGHTFTDEEKKALLRKEQIGPFSDFVSKKGANFTASVKLGLDGGCGFVFEDRKND